MPKPRSHEPRGVGGEQRVLKRKKKAAVRLTMWNANGEIVYDDRLENLRLPNEVILSMSVEFFDDPEPCQIHRGACMARAFAEIEMTCTDRCAICELPDEIQRFFGLYRADTLCISSEKAGNA